MQTLSTPLPPCRKAAKTRRANTLLRNSLIIAEFNDLYQIKRLRFDDTIQALAHRFALSVGTVRKILKSK